MIHIIGFICDKNVDFIIIPPLEMVLSYYYFLFFKKKFIGDVSKENKRNAFCFNGFHKVETQTTEIKIYIIWYLTCIEIWGFVIAQSVLKWNDCDILLSELHTACQIIK